jgi:hypothetical protein
MATRGRPKGSTTKPHATIQETENKWKKLFNQFSVGINSGTGFNNTFFLNSGSMFVNDPYLLNQRIKQLKSIPSFLDRESIEQALLNPEYNEMALRNATQSAMYLTYPLYKLMMLYEGILTYNNYVFPKYVPQKDMNTPRFKSDAKFMDMWLKKLDPKKQFRRITAEVLPEGKRAYYIRQGYDTKTDKETCDYVHFEELPSDWIRIVKKSTDSHFVVAMNFAYFWQAGTSLGQFPPIFSEYYNELMGVASIDKDGNPFIDMDKIKTPKDVVIEYNNQTMTWYYWKELPSNECFVFSFDESNAVQASPFISLLLMSQDLGSYALLQQQLLSIPLYSIILGEIQLNDEKNNTSSAQDDYKLSPDAVQLFESKINSNMPPGTTYNMTPAKSNEMFKFQEIPNANKIYTMGLEGLIDTSFANTLLTTNPKPSVAQSTAGRIIETRFIDRIYSQYKQACNIILRNMYEIGDLKYEWCVTIFGDAFSDKDLESTISKNLGLSHKELLPRFLALHDLTLLDADGICDWVDAVGIYDKFQPLINSFTTSNSVKDNKTGRTAISADKIENDNTAVSNDYGTNLAENRSFALSNMCLGCGKELEIGHFCNEECEEIYKEKILEEEDEDGDKNE